jgi:hypothetical protein
MSTMSYPTTEDWNFVITPGTKSSEMKTGRRQVFDWVHKLFRYGIEMNNPSHFDFSNPAEQNNIANSEIQQAITSNARVNDFFETLRNAKLQSIGIHNVDPIAGRVSKIWSRVKISRDFDSAKAEVYAIVWNRLYRRVFRPNATLINSIECRVLPWQDKGLFFRTCPCVSHNNSDWFSQSFFVDTIALASKLKDIIEKFVIFPNNLNGRSNEEEIFQHAWNKLNEENFIPQLNRVANKFVDKIIDDKNARNELFEYLMKSVGGSVPSALQNINKNDPQTWHAALDVIQALQSSILSQPAFCDENGLWMRRYEINTRLCISSNASIYFIFGLAKHSKNVDTLLDLAERTLGELAITISKSPHIKLPTLKSAKPSYFVKSVLQELQKHEVSIKLNPTKAPIEYEYYISGPERWLCIVEILMREAKHEGHPITYNFGYGSLAYAQSHLYNYESPPSRLERLPSVFETTTFDEYVLRLVSYIKGFYSIFGNRQDRGLWFNELGEYCGIYESAENKSFEETQISPIIISAHEETVMFGKINGDGFIDILDHSKNQIVRIKNGEIIDMAQGDVRRIAAINKLTHANVFPHSYREVISLLVNQLVEQLQRETHGTCFVISISDQKFQNNRDYCLPIELQAKTLVQHFSRLSPPFLSQEQLKDYVKAKAIPQRHLKFFAELANLDGGLWLRLTDTGLEVQAAQQFIPLLKLGAIYRPIDLHMDLNKLDEGEVLETSLPKNETNLFTNTNSLKTFFAALKGDPELQIQGKIQNYVDALSFLNHSGTKTHSLWGLSMTAKEKCLCVVLSSDGNVYLFYDGREFVQLEKTS